MKKDQLEKWLEIAKKPSVLLSALAVIGVAVNLFIYIFVLSPQYTEQLSLKNRQQQLQNQVQLMQKKPVPAKITEKDIEVLVKQVPVAEELPRLLTSLGSLEKKSGSKIVSLTLGEDRGNADPFAAAVASASGAQQSSQPPKAPAAAQGAGGSGSAGTNAQQGKASNIGFTESRVNLLVTGNYTQIMDFVNGLYQLDRLVTIQQWRIAAISQPATAPAANSSTTGSKQQASSAQASAAAPSVQSDSIELKLSFSVYSALQYAGKFKDLPDLQAQAPEKRIDPTMSDEQFIQLLQSLGK